MVRLHAFLVLMSGFLTMLFLSVACSALLGRLTSGEESKSSARAALFNVLGSFVAGAAGGYVTAWAAGADPLHYIMMLSVAVLAVAALSALQSRGKQPIAYQLALVAIAPIGVLAGGLLRLRVLGLF